MVKGYGALIESYRWRERPEYEKKNLSQCQKIQYKSYTNWPGIETLVFAVGGPEANRLSNGMASNTYSSSSDGLVALVLLPYWLPGHNLQPTVPVYHCMRSSDLSSTHPAVH